MTYNSWGTVHYIITESRVAFHYDDLHDTMLIAIIHVILFQTMASSSFIHSYMLIEEKKQS